MKNKNMYFIIGKRGYGKAYHEFQEVIKELEDDKDQLLEENIRLRERLEQYGNTISMYRKNYEEALEEVDKYKKLLFIIADKSDKGE